MTYGLAGKLTKLMPKDEWATRLGHSPDVADALIQSMLLAIWKQSRLDDRRRNSDHPIRIPLLDSQAYGFGGPARGSAGGSAKHIRIRSDPEGPLSASGPWQRGVSAKSIHTRSDLARRSSRKGGSRKLETFRREPCG